MVGAGPGRAACDAAAAAELGINGKSFGRLRRILPSLRDGSGGAGGGQDRSVRVGGSGRQAVQGGGGPGLRRPVGPGREARRGVGWGERQGSAGRAAAAFRHPGPGPGGSAVVCGSPGAPPPLSPRPFGPPSLSPNRGPPPPDSVPPLGPSGSVSSHFCVREPGLRLGVLSFPTVASDLFLHPFSGVSKAVALSTQGLLGGSSLLLSLSLSRAFGLPSLPSLSLLSFPIPVPSFPRCLAHLRIRFPVIFAVLLGFFSPLPAIRVYLTLATLRGPIFARFSNFLLIKPCPLYSCHLAPIPSQSLASTSGRSLSSTHYSAFP